MLGLGIGASLPQKEGKSGGNLPFDPYSTGHIDISNISTDAALRPVVYYQTQDPENIKIAGIAMNVNLQRVDYINANGSENLKINNIQVICSLTHI